MHALERLGETDHALHARVRGFGSLRHLLGRDLLPFRNVQSPVQCTGMLDGALYPMRTAARSIAAYFASVLPRYAELKG